MIVARRLVTAASLAAVVIVLGVAATGRNSRDTTSSTNVSVHETPLTPAATAASSVSHPAVRPVASPQPSPSSRPIAASALPDDADVEQLVPARGPAPDPTTIDVDDGHGEVPSQHSPSSAADVAAATAVAMWSWRFDDPPSRLADTLTGVATPEVIAELTPALGELDRRRVAGEVAWAIVTPGLVIADPGRPGEVVVEITGSQHVTTATTAEVVMVRTVSVRLRAVAGGWHVVDAVQR